MSLHEPSARRSLPVRLTEIALPHRYRAAIECMERASQRDRAALLAVAIRPSDTVYFVHPSAADLVQRIAA